MLAFRKPTKLYVPNSLTNQVFSFDEPKTVFVSSNNMGADTAFKEVEDRILNLTRTSELGAADFLCCPLLLALGNAPSYARALARLVSLRRLTRVTSLRRPTVVRAS
jgi:hypothetical protein